MIDRRRFAYYNWWGQTLLINATKAESPNKLRKRKKSKKCPVKSYIAEGKCSDDIDDQEEEFRNLTFMTKFSSHVYYSPLLTKCKNENALFLWKKARYEIMNYKINKCKNDVRMKLQCSYEKRLGTKSWAIELNVTELFVKILS